MVTDPPVIRREVIARAFRPAGTTSVDSAMKTLRAHKFVTTGVPVPLRAGVGGRLAGQVAFYAALNLDAALMARLGHASNAARLAAEAGKIEGSADFQVVTRYLRDHAHSADATRELAKAAAGSAQLRAALKRLTDRMATARRRLSVQCEGDATVAGTVLSISGDIAEFLADSGERLALPAAQLRDWDLGVGSALVVRTIALDRGSALWQVLPGLDLEATDASRHNPYAEEPKALGDRDRDALERLLADEPTIPAMAPVVISRPTAA